MDRLRFAFASCQHYETGFFTAYRHMAAEDLDVVFHLGDYIYEGPGRDTRCASITGSRSMTLEDYRNRYAQYKTDPDLQAAHAAFPWIVTWDDHEVDNNYAGDISENERSARRVPARRAAAYQAYYEHMPLRRRPCRAGPAMRLYRQFSFGQLASFFVLDTRQYRTDQPCGDGTKAPCPGVADPQATLLGAAQERWLFDGLRAVEGRMERPAAAGHDGEGRSAPGADERYSMDQWAGYDADRTRLLEFLGARAVESGRAHRRHPHQLGQRSEGRLPRREGAGGGDGVRRHLDHLGRRRHRQAAGMKDVLAENPFVKFHNAQRGYVSCEVTPKAWRADYQVVDYVTRPGAPRKTRASFSVTGGRPGAERL